MMAGGNPLPQETRPVWTSQAMVGVPSSATAPPNAGVRLHFMESRQMYVPLIVLIPSRLLGVLPTSSSSQVSEQEQPEAYSGTSASSKLRTLTSIM